MLNTLKQKIKKSPTELVEWTAKQTRAMFQAVKEGNLDALDGVLLSDLIDVNARNENGETPLMIACQTGNKRIVEALLAKKANPAVYSRRGDTPLFCAIERQHFDLVPLLLQDIPHGHKVLNAGPKQKTTPLVLTIIAHAQPGAIQAATLLLGKGANPDLARVTAAPIVVAAHENHIDLVSLLLQHDARVDAKDPFYKQTALALAAGHGNKDMVELLLQFHANPNLTSEHPQYPNFTPLLIANTRGHKAIAEILRPLQPAAPSAPLLRRYRQEQEQAERRQTTKLLETVKNYGIRSSNGYGVI